MAKFLLGWSARLLALIVAAFLALAGFTLVKDNGLLSPFGIESESQDTQVINAVTRTQEVALVSLAVEGITEEKLPNTDVLGLDIPGTGRATFLRYSFEAKLGINGEAVQITTTAASAYSIAIPDFIVIGYDQPSFEVAVEDDGVLSWVRPDINEVGMVSNVFGDAAQKKYLQDYGSQLEDQAKVFYNSLITSIDPAAETTFEFQD